MKPFNNLEKKTLWDTYWRFQLVCKKIQAHVSLEPPLEYNQNQMTKFIVTFLTILGVTEILCSFKLVLEGKIGKDIPESSRPEFLEKFSGKTFALSDTEDTSGLLNREV